MTRHPVDSSPSPASRWCAGRRPRRLDQATGLARGGIVPRRPIFVVVAEGRLENPRPLRRSRDRHAVVTRARLAVNVDKDPRLVELILSELVRVVRAKAKGVLIVEHRSGFVMANAGIDQSNVASPVPQRALPTADRRRRPPATLRGTWRITACRSASSSATASAGPGGAHRRCRDRGRRRAVADESAWLARPVRPAAAVHRHRHRGRDRGRRLAAHGAGGRRASGGAGLGLSWRGRGDASALLRPTSEDLFR